MQELTVIGVEGGVLVAASDDGERFRIRVDDILLTRLRQATQSPAPGSVKLTPREVQSRIRGGLSAEEVARVTGGDLDYIRRFERPVLAEREHIVSTALAIPVQPIGDFDLGEEPTTFGTAIRERLAALGALGERWASWKDDEAGWMVKLEFAIDSIDRDARWSFDPRKHALHPVNAEATTLSQAHEPRAAALIPRLRAVPAEPDETSRFDSGAFNIEPFEPEAAPGDTVPYSRSMSSPAATRAAITRAEEPSAEHGDTADLLEALRRRRGEREARSETPSSRPAPATTAPAPPAEPTPRTEARPAAFSPEASAPASPGAERGFGRALERDPEPDPEPQRAANTAARSLWGGKGVSSTPQAARAPKKGRASMPSWDEIVFGARTDDDLA